MVDLPTRHAGEWVADRPLSAPQRGRSTTVSVDPGQIDHRLRRAGGRSTTVSVDGGADRPPFTPRR